MSEVEDHYNEVERIRKERIDQFRMEDAATKMELEGFVDSLNPAQLKTLQMMLVLSEEEAARNQYIGAVMGCMVWKHGGSWAGGDNPFSGPASTLLQKAIFDEEPDMNNLERMQTEAANKRAENMKLYALIPDPNGGDYFICEGCGKFYVSLEDRMLRDPGVKGCDGCQEKAKWG